MTAAVLAACLLSAAPALAADGDLIPSFGSGGTVLAQFGSGTNPDTYSGAAAVQSDGKIVVAGCAGDFNASTNQFLVARYNPDGSLDRSFGSGGKMLFQPSSPSATHQYACAHGLAIQPDGKIVVAGYAHDATDKDEVAVARLNPNGSLDPSFGAGGMVVNQYDPGAYTEARSLALDGSKIVVAGYDSPNGVVSKVLVVRLNSDGTPDIGFGSGGVVDTQLAASGSSNHYSEANGVVIGAGGKLLLAGYAYNSLSHDAAMIARLNPDGSLDTSFGTGGVALGDFGDPSHPTAGFDSLALAPDGKIAASGFASDSSGNSQFLVAQLNPDGSFDSSFGTGGAFVHQYSTLSSDINSTAVSIAAQPNNKLLVTGYVTIGGTFNSLTVRLNPDGTPDPSFASGGVLLADRGQTPATGSAYSDNYFILPQSDGTALLVGDASDTVNAKDEQLLLEKLTVDEPPAASFTPPAPVLLERPASFSGASSSDPDGTVVSWQWNFGDGHAASGASVTHAFTAPGSYPVTLTVTDDYGLSSSATHTVTVPPLPRCVVTPKSRTIFYETDAGVARKHKAQGQPLDALRLTVTCSESARMTVTGSVKATGFFKARNHKRKRKRTTRSFGLPKTVATVTGGKGATITIRVPAAVIALLRHGFKESASLTITAAAGTGSSSFTLTVRNLKAKRAPRHKKHKK